MKHIHIKALLIVLVDQILQQRIFKRWISMKNPPILLSTKQVLTGRKIGHLPKLSILFINLNLWKTVNGNEISPFLYLCNGLMQFERGIQLFSFCCMYRKKSFGEKARILWERKKHPFRILHQFIHSNTYWVLFRDSKLFQLFLSFVDY